MNEHQPSTDRAAAPDEGPTISGKAAILSIVMLAVIGSVGSWFYYARLQQRPLALWGSRSAALMLRAPVARALRLAPAPTSAVEGQRVLEVAGQRLAVIAERDVSQARGFSHIRNSFVHDASFGWDDPPRDCQPAFNDALEFVDGDDSVIVALSFDCAVALRVGGDRHISIRPVAAEIKSFIDEQFPAAEPAPQPAERR